MAGVDILKAGGNCIDAAIGTNAVLGLTEPQMNGMGGDLFAIIWSQRDQRLYGLNASGRAPYSWNLNEAAGLGLTEIPRVSPVCTENSIREKTRWIRPNGTPSGYLSWPIRGH